MSVAAIVLAGGAGTRLRASQNKVYLTAGGSSLLAWSLRAFEQSDLVDQVVLVTREADRDQVDALLSRKVERDQVDAVLARGSFPKVRARVNGGGSRHDSEKAGLSAIADEVANGQIDLILVHDAARPFVSGELLRDLIETARSVGGAIPGLELQGIVWLVTADGTAQPVATDSIRRVQTPQAFHAEPLVRAYEAAERDGFQGVDTAQTVERYSDLAVAVIPGDPRNIKVTFAEDLSAVEEIAASWAH